MHKVECSLGHEVYMYPKDIFMDRTVGSSLKVGLLLEVGLVIVVNSTVDNGMS